MGNNLILTCALESGKAGPFTMDPLEIAMVSDKSVDSETGLLRDDPGCWTNWEPVELGAGSAIVCAREGYRYRVSCYRGGYDESLSREYCYDEESNWTMLASTTELGEWLTGASTFPQDCFIRITVQCIEGSQAACPRTVGDAIELKCVEPAFEPMPGWAESELDHVASRIDEVREPGDLVLVVMSDIHYSTGCIWPQTARNVHAVVDRIRPDAIVQLGDVSDGMAPADVTISFVTRVLGDLQRCGVPVHSCVGNHDTNYFGSNDQPFSKGDCARLYLDCDDPYYYVDFADARTRCVFLDSFEQKRKERYGFSSHEVRWLKRVLKTLPHGWKVLVFAHVPPLPEIHYWSDKILNGDRLLSVLSRFDRSRRGAVLGYVHGHSHVDQVYRKPGVPFPIVSIGCAKFEDFEECKPPGSFTPKRVLGDASQDLWDVLVVKPGSNKLEFVRFGAGEDKSVAKRG